MCQLSTELKGATVEDLKRANKCVNLLKSKNIKMRFENVGDLQKTHLVVFADAIYGNFAGSASQGRFISFLTNGNGQCCPISLTSEKVKIKVKSALAAETLAMADATDSAYLMSMLLGENIKGPKVILSIMCFTDNKSLYDASHTTNTISE